MIQVLCSHVWLAGTVLDSRDYNRTFPSSQKVQLDSTALKENTHLIKMTTKAIMQEIENLF